MKRVIVAVLVLAVLAVLAYVGAGWWADKQLKAGLDAVTTSMPDGATLTYDHVHYELLADTATVDGLKGTMGASGGTVAVKQAVIHHPNRLFGDALARAQADPASVADDAVLPVARTIELEGVTLSMTQTVEGLEGSTTVTYGVAKSTLTGLKLFLAPLVKPLPALEPTDEDELLPLPDTLRAQLQRAARVTLAYAYDEIAMSGLALQADLPTQPAAEGQTLGPTSIKATVPSLSAHDVGRGRSGATEIDGMQMLFGQGDAGIAMKVARIAAGKIDLSNLYAALLAGKPFRPAMADGLDVTGLVVESMEFSGPMLPEPIAIQRFAVPRMAFAQGVPTAYQIKLGGVRVPAALVTVPYLHTLFGLDDPARTRVESSIDISYAADPASGRATLDRFAVTLVDGFAFEASSTTSGLGAMLKPDAPDAPEPMLVKAAARFQNQGFLQRAIAALAQSENTTVAAEMKQMTGTIGALKAAKDTPPSLKAAADAMLAFLAEPKSLALTIDPPQPVSLVELGNGDPASVEKLGLKVVANQP